MNVEIGTEAALFPEKEYISGIFLAMRTDRHWVSPLADDDSGFSLLAE